MKLSRLFFLLLSLYVFPILAQAQSESVIERFEDRISSDEPYVYFDLYGLQAGDILYIRADSTDFDAYFAIGNITLDEIFAEADDVNGTNPALTYEVTAAGDYSIGVGDCCDKQVSGSFVVTIGINTPEALNEGAPTTDTRRISRWIKPLEGQTPQVQEVTGSINGETPFSFYPLKGLKRGEEVFVYTESSTFDTYVLIGDFPFQDYWYIENDDYNDTNAALRWVVPADGDYLIAIGDCCNEKAQGQFRVQVGLNAPDVLSGKATITGDDILSLGSNSGLTDALTSALSGSTDRQDGAIHVFENSVSEENEYTFYDLVDMKAGDTLYIRAYSDEIDTLVLVGDISFENVLAENDDGPNSVNSILEYTIPENGDYSVAVTDCCSSTAEGSFQVVIGLNAPDVLSGTTTARGEGFAELFIANDKNTVIEVTNPDDGQVQVLTGDISSSNEYMFYDLYDMKTGDVIYAYLDSAEFDALLALGDINFDEVLIKNDDYDGTNSAISFTIPRDGDYSIAVTDCCSHNAAGNFTLYLGVNAPEVLQGNVNATGADIASPYVPQNDSGGMAQIQEVKGGVSPESEFVFYDLYDMQAGQTLYVYVRSDQFDTRLALGDLNFDVILAENDDYDGTTNSALSYTFEEAGNYSIAISDCCSTTASGQFTMLVGLDSPQVLTGDAKPTGAEIVIAYQGSGTEIYVGDIMEISDCSVLQERPVLSGPHETAESTHFIVHYTTTGLDKANIDFVNEVIQAAETSYDVQINRMGWFSPPLDCGEGGDDRIDIYLQDILPDDLLGFASPGGLIGDNPYSSAIESRAAYSYLVVDNDFNGYSPPLTGMRATVAHELNHVLQFGIDADDSELWLYEAVATWVETRVFQEDEAASPYVDDLFQTMDQCLGHDDKYYSRVYAYWILMDSIANQFGDRSILALWEFIGQYDGMEAFYQFIEALGVDPIEIMVEFGVKSLLLDFELGTRFGSQVLIEGKINQFGIYTPRRSGIEQLGIDYLLIGKPKVYNFSVDQPNLSMYVIGIDSFSQSASVIPLGQAGAVDTTPYSYAYLMILNTDLNPYSDPCEETLWEIEVTDGVGQTMKPAIQKEYSALRFIPAN
ncbi:hypothetical protein MASR2M15_16120 [Anaerolineales bacterium]